MFCPFQERELCGWYGPGEAWRQQLLVSWKRRFPGPVQLWSLPCVHHGWAGCCCHLLPKWSVTRCCDFVGGSGCWALLHECVCVCEDQESFDFLFPPVWAWKIAYYVPTSLYSVTDMDLYVRRVDHIKSSCKFIGSQSSIIVLLNPTNSIQTRTIRLCVRHLNKKITVFNQN